MARSMSRESSREGLPSIFPVPIEHRAEPSAMPVPRTSFVGREREVGLVQALLRRSDVRLVTVTGPGGVGKTRTAIRAVSSALHSAQFVDLADVQQPALVLPTIAAALGSGPTVVQFLTISGPCCETTTICWCLTTLSRC